MLALRSMPVLIALFVASSALGGDPVVVVGKEEILYLDQLAAPVRWAPAEATVEIAAERTPGNRPALCLHIPVDHHAGPGGHRHRRISI